MLSRSQQFFGLDRALFKSYFVSICSFCLAEVRRPFTRDFYFKVSLCFLLDFSPNQFLSLILGNKLGDEVCTVVFLKVGPVITTAFNLPQERRSNGKTMYSFIIKLVEAF